MARVITVLSTTGQRIVYSVVEDGTPAGAADKRDVLADLTAGGFNANNSPLFQRLNNGNAPIANQADARTLVYGRIDTIQNLRAAAPAGATGAPQVTLDPNISGALAGNFRLDIGCSKAADADTATFIVELSFRHSITL